MVSLARTIRNMRRVGLKEWWHQMQYIGDAKAGRLVGKDQCVPDSNIRMKYTELTRRPLSSNRFGNRYFENLNAEEEVPGACSRSYLGIGVRRAHLHCFTHPYSDPGRHRWVDFAQHDFNATQVPPEWHSWISHIRKDPPTEDAVMQALSPPWKAVRLPPPFFLPPSLRALPVIHISPLPTHPSVTRTCVPDHTLFISTEVHREPYGHTRSVQTVQYSGTQDQRVAAQGYRPGKLVTRWFWRAVRTEDAKCYPCLRFVLLSQ
jgi:NADH dehydrogenase (ubiquinone) 1 alpha subcomplex subunit 12